jgi:RNA polymerase sigma factor (sigma-70 family)
MSHIIGVKKLKGGTENNLVSLKEYLKISKKLISTLAPKFRSGLAKEMLADEDVLSEAAFNLMKGDMEWNGNGNIYGYRKQRIIWFIQTYMTKQKENRTKPTVLSLDWKVFDEKILSRNNKVGDLSNIIQDSKQPKPEDILQKKELMTQVIHIMDTKLSPNEKQCILLRYIDNKTLSEIGCDVKLS